MSVKQRVYVETTIVSYLTARPSRDLIIAAHQAVTRQWWERRRSDFELFISQFVLTEAAGGNSEMAGKRLELLQGIEQLPVTDEVIQLGRAMVEDRVLPHKAEMDALHLSVACVHEMDALLTWNCRHLANVDLLREMGRYLGERGYEVPIVTTPDALIGG
jgi:hypothetical protein